MTEPNSVKAVLEQLAEAEKQRAEPNLSLILGGGGTTLEELVGAYRALPVAASPGVRACGRSSRGSSPV